MSNKCKLCKNYFPIPKDELDYEEGMGDCIREITDTVGKFWHARKVKGEMDASKCPDFRPSLSPIK